MKKTLAGLLMCGSLAAPCFGEIKFDWQEFDKIKEAAKDGATSFDAKVDMAVLECNKADIVQAVKDAALKFTDKQYADYDACDFITRGEVFVVTLSKLGDSCGRYEHTSNGNNRHNAVSLNVKLLKDKTLLKLITLHEFSHAYDMLVFGDRMPSKLKRMYLEVQEARATQKEKAYLHELKSSVPADIYEKLMCIYAGDNYFGAYLARGPVLKEWMNR